MDKNTYNIKVEKIQKLVKNGDYESAVKVADTVDWEEVHSVRLLTITAAAYEHTRDYKTAIELLEMAYEESAVGKRILYKLTGLAIADRNVEQAQRYYEMYLQEAPDDNGRYLLRYLLSELKGEPLDKRIAILETYRKYEFEEQWALRLAQLYDEAGMAEPCVKLCDEIVLWFGVGQCVDEALKLKEKYAPLTEDQMNHRENKDFYEQRYREVVEEYTSKETVTPAVPEAPAEEEAAVMNTVPPTWPERIILLEAEDMQDAVRKSLEKLSEYYNKKELPMSKLTHIPAEKFNRLGLAASRPHIEGKDLLVDNASQLSEELLSDIVSLVRDEQYPQVFLLADDPTQLAYLDARLGEYLNAAVLPSIEMSSPEEVRISVEEVMDEVEKAAEAPEYMHLELETAEEEVHQEAAPAEENENTAPVEETAETAEQPEQAEEIAPEPSVAAETEETAQSAREESAELPAATAEELLSDTYVPDQMVLVFDQEPVIKETAEAAEEITEAAEEIAETAEESAETAAEEAEAALEIEVKEAAEEIAEAAEETAEAAKEAAEAAAEEVSTALETGTKEAAEEIAEAAEETAEAAKEAAETIRVDMKAIKEAMKAEAAASAAAAAEEIAEEKPAEAPLAEAKTETAEAAEEAEDPETDLLKKLQAQLSELNSMELAAHKETAAPDTEKVVNFAAPASGMGEDAFVEYAKNYLTSIDCVLDEGAEQALHAAAASRLSEGTALSKEEAEQMIEDAANRAEKKLFAKRYTKDGFLILREKHII